MIESNDADLKSIALSLSGGGVRAIAFHSGVLQYMAERGELESIDHISSVSGGSLFIGLVMSNSDFVWPSSKLYIEQVLPKIRIQLTSISLQSAAIKRLLFNPLNWRYVLSRANVVAKAIEAEWNIKVALGCVPNKPSWSINGTTAETGRRFRFKNSQMGDYELGYADASDFPLASALAVSAAFPGGIGPLQIESAKFFWYKQDSWDSKERAKQVKLSFKKLHLYDGGLYDNLGLETFFDIGKQAFKVRTDHSINYLVVSDAGAAFVREEIPSALNPLRFKRIADISFDQSRALRVRSLIGFLQKQPRAGVFLQLGTDAIDSIRKLGNDKSAPQKILLSLPWLTKEQAHAASHFKTSLKKLTDAEFQLISRHGYETAKWNAELFSD